MKVVEEKPVPIYEARCNECYSKIEFIASEVMWGHIDCPICGTTLWVSTVNPVGYESSKDVEAK